MRIVMKKKLITALLTSVVMLAAMGIFVWKMSGISDKLSSEDKAKIEEEKAKQAKYSQMMEQVKERLAQLR